MGVPLFLLQCVKEIHQITRRPSALKTDKRRLIQSLKKIKTLRASNPLPSTPISFKHFNAQFCDMIHVIGKLWGHILAIKVDFYNSFCGSVH